MATKVKIAAGPVAVTAGRLPMDIGPMRMAGILAKTCGPGGEEAGEEGFGEESPGELALEEIGTLLRDKKYNEAIKAIEKLKNGA